MRRVLIPLLTLIPCTWSASVMAQSSPPPGYNWIMNPANEHHYALTNPKEWLAADAEADQLGPQVSLVTIRNSQENDWLKANVVIGQRVWIGLNDLQSGGVWEWRNGEPVTFLDWAPGCPNGGGLERVVLMGDHFSQWDDWVVGGWNYPGVLEWIPPSLTASASQVSAVAGGTIAFTLDFAPGDAGSRYKLLGSATGTGLTWVGGIEIPLSNGDWLWDAMIAFPGPSVFQSNNGNLDANGDASCTLTLPPGLASSLIGSTLYFSAALYLPATYQGLKASNPVSLMILP